MNLLLSVLLFLCLVSLNYGIDIDRGYPKGFFKYGDKNGDGFIDDTDIQANLNLAWLNEWYGIIRNSSKYSREFHLTENEFNELKKRKGQGQKGRK